jgi:phage-related baseplate assembly protein
MAAHVDVLDVAVTSPMPGKVRLTVLALGGLPTPGLLEIVAAAVSSERVRPLTDSVDVVAPVRVGYAIEAEIRLEPDVDAGTTLQRVEAAAAQFAAERRATLGRSLVRTQLIAALMVDGVYSVALAAPAEAALAATEWADCDSITVAVSGG